MLLLTSSFVLIQQLHPVFEVFRDGSDQEKPQKNCKEESTLQIFLGKE